MRVCVLVILAFFLVPTDTYSIASTRDEVAAACSGPQRSMDKCRAICAEMFQKYGRRAHRRMSREEYDSCQHFELEKFVSVPSRKKACGEESCSYRLVAEQDCGGCLRGGGYTMTFTENSSGRERIQIRDPQGGVSVYRRCKVLCGSRPYKRVSGPLRNAFLNISPAGIVILTVPR